MTERYSPSELFFALFALIGYTLLVTPSAVAQCADPTIQEDVEGVTRNVLTSRGWEIFGTSISSSSVINGTQSFRTSNANGNDPADNRVVRSPYANLTGDVCVNFDYEPLSPAANTFLRVGFLTRDDTFYEIEEIDLNGVTSVQTFTADLTASQVDAIAQGAEVARVSIEFNGDNAGGNRLLIDDLTLRLSPRYDQGGEDYSNRAPTAADDMYSTQIGQEVTGDVLANDTDADIEDGIDAGPLTVSVDTDVSNGTLTLNADGTFEYTADTDGADSFTYTVCDNGYDVACSTATASFDVALPVELGPFTASASGRTITLRWSTLSETDNDRFEVQQSVDGRFQTVGTVRGQGTTTESTSYRFAVDDLAPGEHTFRLRQVDVDGTAALSPEVTARVDLSQSLTLRLAGRNPFQNQTTLEIGVQTAQMVTVDLFDVLGRRVRTLYRGTPTPGRLHPITVEARGLAPGRYLVRARTAARQITQPITVVQ